MISSGLFAFRLKKALKRAPLWPFKPFFGLFQITNEGRILKFNHRSTTADLAAADDLPLADDATDDVGDEAPPVVQF